MEAWPATVEELALPFEEVPLSTDDMRAIGAWTPEFRDLMDLDDLPALSAGFRAKAAAKLALFPEGAHARLGGCSFKRAGRRIAPARTSAQLQTALMQANPRVASLLADALRDDYGVSLFLRRWTAIPVWSEFRLFMIERRFVGISQYHHLTGAAEIGENLPAICDALHRFARLFRVRSHIDTCIADVFVDRTAAVAVLIDVNPFIQRSDPCLYSWQRGGDFDGALRYRDAFGRIVVAHPRAILQAA